MGHSHRSTLKGSHKPFKSKHSSKGALKNQHKGKVEKENAKGKTNKVVSKLERKNLSHQLRNHKIIAKNIERKLFSGSNAAEKIVTVLTLTNDISAADIVEKLLSSCRDPSDVEVDFEVPSVTSVKINRFKSNLKIIIPDQTNLVSTLDACKVSDFVVLGMSATEEIDPQYGEQIVRAIELQAISSVLPVIPNLETAYPKRNLQLDILRSLTSYFQHFFPTEDKIYNLEAQSDALNAIRVLCQKFPKSVTWRDSRGYLVADDVSWSNAESQIDGHLVVEGTVRGVGFNVNRLVHLPGFGDFQVDRIEKLIGSKPSSDDEEIDFKASIELQESLEELAPKEYDMSDIEAEELDMDDFHENIDGGGFNPGAASYGNRKIPKGMSEYQSRWFLEDELDELADEVGEEEQETDEFDEEMDLEDENGDQSAQTEYQQSEMFVELSPEEEARQLEQYQQRAKDDLEFPDEIELEPTESAVERLARYRGVKSLANCEWDWDEYDDKRPSEFERLLRISNYKATKNKIMKEAIQESQVVAGNKVKIYIKAPRYILEKIAQPNRVPFTVYGLAEHEHKLAIVNFSIQTWEDREDPIPAKENIIVQYGARRQVIKPIFSANSNNANNVHKYERFLHPGSVSIATCIAPVSFTNAPAIFFKQSTETGKIELLGHGTFLNCDHSRVLAKRIVLTGHPLKIHKRVVTVRYMFFNADDINHYKQIPLFTKTGRSGFIKESLGTHGYFKATFDGKLSAQDVIAMPLYKRVWPRNSIPWSG